MRDPALLRHRGGGTAALREPAAAEQPADAPRRCEIGGRELPAGTFVTLAIGAANRDPAQFHDPDRLDVGRKPNRHLAFGHGAHACAGMNVARLEARIAFGRLLARFPRSTWPARRSATRACASAVSVTSR